MDKKNYETYLAILKEELLPAMGCTEPIAVAYGAAKARELLETAPEKIEIWCSRNIIKNAGHVTVPNFNEHRGIEAAAVLGATVGKSERKLQVLSQISEEERREAEEALKKGICSCMLAEKEEEIYIRVELESGEKTAAVEIRGAHDHITRMEKNGCVVFEEIQRKLVKQQTDRSLLNLKNILEFADQVELADIQEVIGRQIQYNTAIAQEGLQCEWGACVGRTLARRERTAKNKAVAMAAAGSDARMNGCALPVVINSGSGNQGITCTVPVIVYAKELHAEEERLYRALVLSNLIAVHQKQYIGKLSAYCGAVSAGCAAACGVAYLKGEGYDTIGRTILNTLGNVAGIVCDGAKSSCAAKIASAVDAGLLALEMAEEEHVFLPEEGLIKGDYEQAIRTFGYLGKVGMKQTDITILNIMLNKEAI